MSNPLLEMGHDLPNYSAIEPAHIEEAISSLLQAAHQSLDQAIALQVAPTWDNLIVPLEETNQALGRAWGVVNHLTSVVDSTDLRAAHAKMLPEVTAYSSAFEQSLELFEQYKKIHTSDQWQQLTTAQQKVITNSIRDFQLGGAELPEALKPRFAKISEDLAQLTKTFSDHVLDATDAFLHVVKDLHELDGLPEDILAAAKELAIAHNQEGWAFNLKFPSYYPVQQFARNRQLRQTLYQAYVTRASELGAQYADGNLDWDNSQIMLDILKLRSEEAHLLGFENYAALSIVTKMASSVKEVRSFLGEFASRAHASAKRDLEELQQFASSELNITSLEPWDISFASEKLKQAKYLFSEHDVKQYFPINQVLQGLFHVIQTIFQVKIQASTLPTWHADVQSFEVRNDNNQIVAYFYLDAYARSGKRGGAWMDDARGRMLLQNGDVQTPVAYLICNFPAPITVNGQLRSATISHDDVITLFHEFGHGLHHMLTQVDALGVSGINGVEWDAVELPSQFMENFCWDYEVIQKLSHHIETAEVLPQALFNKMLAAKNFQNGLFTLRQIVFASFDWELHSSFDAAQAKPTDILALSNTINQQIHVLQQSPISRWPHSFSHIFAGGYAAGYYSYKWAEVLSADAFAAFEEKASSFGSILNPEVGIHYRKHILEVGGSRSAAESFKAFRGRPPEIDALLRHGGLLEESA
ncbi:oligopeptidase A [Polynucleobacter sp. SHI8]|uniref:M3 family metallopeptidase n=1 Tax=unclassified Polynucleobacter TaxID=2640945 RepID=UPI002491E640|nr:MULTISPECIES: M3 family metallopeptidase [unclassified Polynucleobacter]BDW10936.1 oligopeptidase A [Polynucleobacter sp. SHI2]BDW13382.1 oligopeptidase A [Polynucleobacter sp. SHI8]